MHTEYGTPLDDAQFLAELTCLFAEASSVDSEAGGLARILDVSMRAVGGHRGFLALVNHHTGVLTVAEVAGPDWTEEGRWLRLHLAQETNRGITGHVALTGVPYVCHDVSRDPYYLPFFDDVGSEIAVPIMGGGRHPRGVINIERPDLGAFGEESKSRLMAVAQAAATLLGVQRFRARERALIEIGMNLTTTLDVEPLVRKVVDVSAEALHYEDCSVFLLDEQTDTLVLRATRGALAERVGVATYRVGEGLTGWVAEHGQPVRTTSVTSDPRWRGLHLEFPAEEIGAFLAVPILSRGKGLGVLRVLRRASHAPWFDAQFTESDERILSTIASQLGAAVENARSYQKLVRSERMAAWGELSARSAHMIGNRAFALKGDLNELRHLLAELPQSRTHDELVSVAASMGRGIERLEEILREFRDFVLATHIVRSPSDINAIVREAVQETFPKRSPVTLSMELAEGLPAIPGDAGKLKRAFAELVENALSFQPERGALSIRTSLADQSDVTRFRLVGGRRYVRIEFRDAGPGVADEMKQRIFRPFFTSRVKGMGLGLSIVQGIIESHQGIIREIGTAGAGACFVVFLPVSDSADLLGGTAQQTAQEGALNGENPGC